MALKEKKHTFTVVRNNLKKARKRQIERSKIPTNDF